MAHHTNTYTFIDTPKALNRVVEELSHANRVGLDTEADSLHHYYEKVCLLQLSFTGKTYLIDTLASLDLTKLLNLLSNKYLILHYAFYDLKMLRHDFNFAGPENFFDTMTAAELLGYQRFSLAALIERHFGIAIPKGRQKSNWSFRPLSEAQLEYAANDTRYLEALAAILADELQQAGRTAWHDECCQNMLNAVRKDKIPPDEENRWRIKGSNALSPRQLAIIRELWQWREEEARHHDVPAFKIMNNDMMMELVQFRTEPNRPDAKNPLKLPTFCRNQPDLDAIDRCFLRGRELPVSQCPQPCFRERPKPDSPEFKRLRKACHDIASGLSISPSVLAPRRILELLEQVRPQSVEQMVEKCGLLPWQAQLIGSQVLAILHDRPI